MRQHIRYLVTPDGVHVAWAETGSGPTLVKPATWLTHLKYDLESPVWRHWMQFLSGHFRYIRYDERGCGMTDWRAADLSAIHWMRDLECVVEQAAIEQPFTLLGISQGAATAIEFAVRHPEKVSRMILYGGYACGWKHRDNPKAERFYEALIELMRHGWGSENSTFRQLFTSMFVPGGTPEQLGWFNELCRRTTTPGIAVELMKARGSVNVLDLLSQVRTPTLVIHARHDKAVPFSEGRLLASGIPHADFVELDSGNHVLLEHEPAWREFQSLVLEFTGAEHGERAVFEGLSRREYQILALITDGLSNAEVAKRLFIDEKTVRNHVSRLFDKLGVSSRSQAIVLAHKQGFQA